MDNLDRLVTLPTGCGEQNMVKFTPNYLVLDFLKDVGMLSEDIERRAKKNLMKGYQRELTYRLLWYFQNSLHTVNDFSCYLYFNA
ncbi:thioester-containing protein 1 allele R1-like [Parasteatoda tepidariorum]|uniref:thioester-containing protein 1 allele R1-like n=1 Tax=Parasteatoda tepidariorum TaxID=114398 RepID=UPI0039BC447E